MQEQKKTKLVQASTIACSSSAMLEQHGSSRSTRSSRLARLARQSRTCRVEPSGIWAYYGREFDGLCGVGLLVTALVTSTKLSYVEPGYYWDW